MRLILRTYIFEWSTASRRGGCAITTARGEDRAISMLTAELRRKALLTDDELSTFSCRLRMALGG